MIKHLKITKVIAIMLTAAIMLCMAGCGKKTPVQVFTFENNSDGTVTITGLTEKGANDASLSIPAQMDGKDVTAIGAEAFRDDANVTKITIAEGIVKIAENAFLNCSQLSDIIFPESLEEIGTNAIKNTPWEKNILESKSEVIIGDILAEVGDVEGIYKVSDDVRVIASGVFYSNTKVTGVSLPDSLQIIGTYAFADSGITEITIPSSVNSIGYNAFLDVEKVSYSGSAQGTPWGAAEVH